MRRAAALLALLLAAAAPRARGDQPLQPLYGRTIASLRFAGDAPEDEKALAAVTDLREGQTLTEAAVRTAMRNLFATRKLSDLAIEAAPAGDRVVVLVRYSAAPRVARVTLLGARLAERLRLRDALSLEVGETWSAERGETAERGVRRVLRERGWFEPEVTTRVDPGPDETSVVITVSVRNGPRALTAPPLFTGSVEPFTTALLSRRAKLREGAVFRPSRAREGAERISAWLHAKEYARAEVRYEGETYDPVRHTAQARYAVFVGPKVVLTVTGASVASVRNHPESPWSREEPPDEEAVARLRQALVKGYQESGYAHVRVDALLRTEPGEDRISVTVRKGERYAVEAVGFRGAHSLPPRELRAALKTRPRGLLSTGRLVEADLEEDRRSLEGLYASRGLPDTRAGKPDVADGRRPFTLSVTFPVEEGPEILVAERRIDGNTRVPDTTLLPFLTVVPGQPYTTTRVGTDEAVLQGWYLSHGYPEARVVAETTLESPAPPRPLAARVVYHVFEGDPVTFGKTVVRGNTRTLTSVVEGEYAYHEGEPFSLGKVIETQQALTRLGVFSRIDVTPLPTDPGTGSRTVLLTVAEAKRWSLVYGLGAEYDPKAEQRFNPRLSLGVTYSNLFGRALVASVEGRWSVRDKRIVGTLRDPTLFSAKVPVSLTVFAADQAFQDFKVLRRGSFIEAERRFSATFRGTLRYQYEIVKPKADPSILSNLERQNQEIYISSIAPAITFDTRNDPVDPHSGILASLDVKYAFSFFSANSRFLKGLFQAAMYRPFAGTVVAVSARAGAIQSYAACDPVAHPDCPPNLEIPIVERFFAGGRSTHRAFVLDFLGIPGRTLLPKDDGSLQAAGGNGLAVANLEWRIPVVGDLGVSLFLDTGNVWADWRDVRLSEFRTGAGLGLHYLTPVGPLRLEYGWKLDRKPDESAGAVSFSVGYPF